MIGLERGSTGARQRAPSESRRRSVTIGLVDGTEETRTLGSFSLAQSELMFATATGAHAILPTERVAYIAYDASVHGRRAAHGAERYKIHVQGSQTKFLVLAVIATEPRAIGFSAAPADLHELLLVDDGVRGLIARKAQVEAIRPHVVQQGMRTLLQDGIEKCVTGQTDLKQVLAVGSR